MSNEIPDVDFIVRYCRPRTVGKNLLRETAFDTRSSETYISANWVPKEVDPKIRLDQVRSILADKNFDVDTNGKFVIFNAGIIKSYVHELTGIRISICHKPSSIDATHVGILPVESNKTDDRRIMMYDMALAMSEFTREHPDSVHPA